MLLSLTMFASFAGCGAKQGADDNSRRSESGSNNRYFQGQDQSRRNSHRLDPEAGSGYSYAHDLGIQEMQKNLGLSDEQIVEKKNNVSDGDPTATETAIVECIEEGCNIIFGTSWGYGYNGSFGRTVS